MAEDPEIAARLAHLEADNIRLRRLLDEAGAPDGLRHGLRDTLAMLRGVLRLSAAKRAKAGGQRAWNAANPELRSAYSARWRADNRPFVNSYRADADKFKGTATSSELGAAVAGAARAQGWAAQTLAIPPVRNANVTAASAASAPRSWRR